MRGGIADARDAAGAAAADAAAAAAGCSAPEAAELEAKGLAAVDEGCAIKAVAETSISCRPWSDFLLLLLARGPG